MSERSGVIGVKVENQVLWVGREAYPVRNIARARVVRLTIRRAAAFGRFLGFALLWLVLGMGATLGLRAARSQGAHVVVLVGISHRAGDQRTARSRRDRARDHGG